MKRCRRCDNEGSSDPYREFSFEKSLRRYGVTPRKIKKLQANQFKMPLEPTKPQVVLTEYSKRNASNEFEHLQHHHQTNKQCEQEVFSPEVFNGAQISKLEQNQIEVREQADEKSDSPHIENTDKEGENANDHLILLQKAEKIEIPFCEHQLKAQQTGEKKEHYCSEIEEIKQNEFHHEEEQGGRLYLNDKVSVSRRTLQKHLTKSTSANEILSQLLESRAYLKDESQAVARRLSEYLHTFDS